MLSLKFPSRINSLIVTYRMGCTCSGQKQMSGSFHKEKHKTEALQSSNNAVSIKLEVQNIAMLSWLFRYLPDSRKPTFFCFIRQEEEMPIQLTVITKHMNKTNFPLESNRPAFTQSTRN